MQYPVVIKNVLDLDLFDSMRDCLDVWSLTNRSYEDDPVFWGSPDCGPSKYLQSFNQFYSAAIQVKFKMMRVLKKDIVLTRIHSNLQTAGQRGSRFHTDIDVPGTFTFVLAMANSWKTGWGGETIMHDPTENEYRYVPYIPNQGCFFPGNWEHYGASPNHYAEDPRITVAFGFVLAEKLDEFSSTYPLGPSVL